jgi:hypothetical protein
MFCFRKVIKMSALNNTNETVNEEVNINEVTDETTENTENVEVTASEEDIAAYNKAIDLVNTYGLKWTFRSIEMLLNIKKVTLNQLRACLFDIDGKAQYNVELACRYLIMAGLINKDNQNKIDELEDKAYEILDSWRENVGFIGVLHIILVNIMESRHFFMGETEGGIMSQIMKKGVQPEIYSKLMGVEAETRINQMKAMM